MSRTWRLIRWQSAVSTLMLGCLFYFLTTGVRAETRKPEVRVERRPSQVVSRRPAPNVTAIRPGTYVVLGYNDLGMHCMNQDFSEICILPPYNTLHAQVIRRGEEPQIVSAGATVNYSIPGNTVSTTKTNFWQYANSLFRASLRPNIGLTGNGLSGTMKPTGDNDWSATGIPVTPVDDKGTFNPYQLAKIDVVVNRQAVASTATVIPVSWEISCDLCHTQSSQWSVAGNILAKHDALHGTRLLNSKPVLCATCHGDAALGTAGSPGVKSLSHAMHGSHASRMGSLAGVIANNCYACHPGQNTSCQRDIHLTKGIQCVDCHGDMTAVAHPQRRPWIDEPKCVTCHQSRRPKFQFEEPGKLYKESRGHGGVHCSACHGSPHAITPTVTPADNVQAIMHQGFPGTIKKCTVCHTKMPDEAFPHRLFGDGQGDD